METAKFVFTFACNTTGRERRFFVRVKDDPARAYVDLSDDAEERALELAVAAFGHEDFDLVMYE